MTPAAVEAVVVNHNAADHLAACIASLRAAGVDRVVVVDNASDDASEAVTRRAGADWLPAGANLGYGRAANLAAARLQGPAVLVANPDLVVDAGAVAALVARLDAEPDLGVVGPQITNPDGSLYPSGRRFPDMVDAIGHGLLGAVNPDNRFTARYRMLGWDHADAARVDWVSGACMLVRRATWEAVGGFDPAYFMYMEDVDLCWRVARAGWGVGYEPAATVMHVQGASTRRHPYRMLAAHHRSMWRFARTTTTGARRAALPLVAVGLTGRLVATAVEHRVGLLARPDARRVPRAGDL
ncbi:MAG TPA: glycosyltransferase family 2 protein [Acidimicrobiales bacterium]|nr:glycosyltransferase family 2 protein [Acidimicrobiales bacterium]